MDETSDPHMETDVSSTTEDVPEMQEVTGSNGNVVLIVEKLEDENVESTYKSKENPSQEPEESSPGKLQTPQQSPPKDAMSQKVVKSPNKPPTIQKIVLKRPSNTIISLDQLKKPASLDKLVTNKVPQATDFVHLEETVDSSSKTEVQKSPNKSNAEVTNKSLNKNVDVEITIRKVPTSVQQSWQKVEEKSSLNEKSPVKINVETTVKDLQPIAQKTPIKEQLNVQKTPVKTPSKEQIEAKKTPQKSPIKNQSEIQKPSMKTPSIELLVEASKTQPIVQKTPIKEQLNVQKTPVRTPPKEQIEAKKTPQKFPIKNQLDIQKPLIKTPSIELLVEPSNTQTKEVTTDDKKVNGDVEECDNKSFSNNNPVPVEVLIEKDASNDSQSESLDSERDQNKSISRELKSLIKSAKESKIISECTQLTSKTRKSRTALDSSNPLNTSVEADRIQGNRRHSSNSQKSNCSEKSDKATVKRSMRSQNPEFVNKVKQFLNSVTKVQKESDEGTDEEIEDVKVKEPINEIRAGTPKKKKLPEVDNPEKPNKLRSDPYCWRCHWAIEQPANEKTHPPMKCTVCPRTFHYKCLSGLERSKINTEKNWVCPECMAVLHAESSETRSPAMKKTSLGMLCELLKFALERMMDLNGVEPFMQSVDRTAFPDYDKYVVHPMDLSLMKENIAAGLYGSTEAFQADAQWILHNSIIFNTLQSKLTSGARALVRSCRAEMGEIEACPECYKAAHARRPTWFTDVCTTPHVLLWAKLKGFPYWPAKAMSVNNTGQVDVRFFGAHDRAWVPAKDCFLYSERDPNNFRTKRQDILDSMQEAEQHIRNISRKYGKFVYPPFKTQFDPTKLTEQIKLMIPSFEGEVRSPMKNKSQNTSPNTSTKSRSNSKSSKEDHDGDTSEGEESSTVATRKMASGVEIAREEEEDKDKTMDVDASQTQTPAKENESRKRRRSELEEAVITVLDTSVSQNKKKKLEDKTKPDDKTDAEPTSSKDVEMKPVDTEKTDESHTQEKSESTPIVKEKVSTPIPGSTEKQKTPRVMPIKIVTTPKGIKTAIRSSTPKIKLVAKKAGSVHKRSASEKRSSKDEKKQKRRDSRNKSLNISTATPGKDKIEKSVDSSKEKGKDNSNSKKKEDGKTDKPTKQNSENKRMQFDDNTSLAVLAQKSKDSESDIAGLPTISSVISLSTTAQNTNTTTSKPTTSNKTIEVTIEANSSSSVFTATSTDNVKNISEAVTKLQKLRSDTGSQSLVGKVGVRAFARMTSPPRSTANTNNKDVEVEIKAEPIDLDDSDRQMEKLDLMNSFHLRPVNPATASTLREVRINKLVVRPLNNARRGKVIEVRPRAKKTFPQPRRPEEGRSELNGKNSMVYIPIQPATTPGPQQRAPRPPVPVSAAAPTATPVIRPNAPVVTTAANTMINTTTSVVPSSSSSSPSSVVSVTSPIQSGPTVGQATVHTVPLITSVNGQWTLSLQPVMSVGGVDGAGSPPLVNGTPERVPNVTNLNNAAGVANVSSLTNNSVTAVTNLTNIANSNVTGVTGAVVPIAAAVVAPPIASNEASRLSDTSATPGEPPRLQQRPPLMNPLDARTPIGNVPPPSTVGPLTAKLNQNAVKLTDFFRNLLEDSIEQLIIDEPAAHVTQLKLQLEQLRWRHQQEIDEINHNHELTIAEMRSSFEKERVRVVSEIRRANQLELETAVRIAKSKQWCANCSQEAQFYCCWNTSYCDYPCQRAHWAQHFAVCTQKRTQDNGDGANTSPPERLQPQPENLPKSAPALTAGSASKARVPQQDSIIMSVMEDASGNQTLKCVGTYKPPGGSAQAQISPVVLNKQMMNNEDNSSKKVVTSGGYLIVGAGVTNASSIVTQPRRSHTIQYFS